MINNILYGISSTLTKNKLFERSDSILIIILLTALFLFPTTFLHADPVRINTNSSAKKPGNNIQAPGAGSNVSPIQEIIVKFRPGLHKRFHGKLHRDVGASAAHRMGRTNIFRVRVPAGISSRELLNQYRKNPDVIYAEPSKQIIPFSSSHSNSSELPAAAITSFRRQFGSGWKVSVDTSTGMVRKISGNISHVLKNSAEQAATNIIIQHPELFGSINNLSAAQATKSLAGNHIHYQQLHNGIPVRGAGTHIHLDKSNRLHAVDSNVTPSLTCTTTPAVSSMQAAEKLKPLLPATAGQLLDAHLEVDGSVPGGRLLWVVQMRSADANAEWEGLVDAQTGVPVSVRNLTVNFDGDGNVFEPNPTRRAGELAVSLPTHGDDICPVPLNSTGSDLTPLVEPVVLNNLDGTGYLENTYLKIVNTIVDGIPASEDYSALHSSAFDSPGLQFFYTYDNAKFEEVNAYYHNERYRQYLSSNLGYSLLDSTPLIIDAHRAGGFVGAAFTAAGFGTMDRIFLGNQHAIAKDPDGVTDDIVCRELGESADVIIHELGHVIRSRIDPAAFYLAPSYEEGWADYLMASFTSDPVVGEWVDEGSITGYRRTLDNRFTIADVQADYGFGPITAAAHFNGQIWGGALWNIRQYIKNLFPADLDTAELADTLVIEGMYTLPPSSTPGIAPTFVDGKDALLLALNLLQNLPITDPHYDPRYVLISSTAVSNEFTKKGIGALLPNDPKFNNYPTDPDTFTLHNTGANGGTEDADIDAPGAWSIQTGRSDVIVGITDTGLNFYHEDIGYEDANFNGLLDPGEDLNSNSQLDQGNVWTNTVEINGISGIDDDDNGYIDDFVGWDFISTPQDNNPDDISFFGSHGTKVASVIGALGNNSIGLTGINWDVQLMGLQIIGTVNSEVSATEGIFYGASNGASVMNASWGLVPWYSFSQSLYDSLRSAADTNVLFIAASGNTDQPDGMGNILNDDNDSMPIFPQSYILPNIINVTATDNQDQQSERHGKYSVDLAASTGAPAADTAPDIYGSIPQTSGAAPHVTGAIALLLSEELDRIDANPGYRTMTMGEIRYLLLTSVDKLPGLVGLCVSEGRLNAHNLLLNYADADMDGYVDRIERLFGTDPADANNMPDFNADADNDGLNNADELAYGSIPNVPVGEDLTQLLYPIFLDVSGNLLSSISSQDSDGDGITDGSEVDSSPSGGNPGFITDPANPDTDGDGLLDNNDPLPSPALVLPLDPAGDEDGDGLTNGEEITYGTDPYVADTDMDGLNDGDEINAGTDPNNSDTDGDLWTDGAEVNAGTDPNSNADYPYPPLLIFDSGRFECVGSGTYPNCGMGGATTVAGSYAISDVDGNGALDPTNASADTKTLLNTGPDSGIKIGVVQPASGSHTGCPDGSETPGLDASWCYFGNTGLYLTSSPITVVDPDVNNDGGFTKHLDFSGWAVQWNGNPTDSLGGDPAFGDTGLGTLVCSQVNCPTGSTFTLDYTFHGDPNGVAFFGLNTYHTVHFEGQIGNTASVVADGDLNVDGLVNAADVLIGQQIALGLIVPTTEQMKHGDVAPLINGAPASNGVIDAADMLLIERKAMGFVSY